MTQSEKLQKVIEKAESNKYKFWNVDIKHITIDVVEGVFKYVRGGSYYASIDEVIFSHDFAKAFWGEEKVCHICDGVDGVHMNICSKRGTSRNDLFVWQDQLQRLVLKPEDERINYLYSFI